VKNDGIGGLFNKNAIFLLGFPKSFLGLFPLGTLALKRFDE
jgi:hypothetical protein